MELFLIVSLLIIPVVLLASPSAIFAIKGRSDIALGYLFSLVLVQIVILAAYWNTPAAAASWVCLLLGVSQLLSLSYLTWKVDLQFWSRKLISFIIFNASILATGVFQSNWSF
ncbi:MAG: hypothetical protein HWE27_04900 [Gammaproteobacteria bacterium]|nr:hypothetical protein [Gammaproteobacteria bacterium]